MMEIKIATNFFFYSFCFALSKFITTSCVLSSFFSIWTFCLLCHFNFFFFSNRHCVHCNTFCFAHFFLNLLKRGKPHTIQIVLKTIDELDGKQSRGKWNGLLFIVQTQLERVCYHSVVVFFIPLWHFCWFTLCFCLTQ